MVKEKKEVKKENNTELHPIPIVILLILIFFSSDNYIRLGYVFLLIIYVLVIEYLKHKENLIGNKK